MREGSTIQRQNAFPPDPEDQGRSDGTITNYVLARIAERDHELLERKSAKAARHCESSEYSCRAADEEGKRSCRTRKAPESERRTSIIESPRDSGKSIGHGQ